MKESIAFLHDAHLGGKLSDHPEYYISESDLINHIRKVNETIHPTYYVWGGDMAHDGDVRNARRIGSVIKEAGVRDAKHVGINGNHERKMGLENNKELWRIYQGEAGMVMIEGVEYKVGEDFSLVGFNGYAECDAKWTDGISVAMNKYHSASLKDLPQFIDSLNKTTAENFALVMHVPPPYGSDVNRMYLDGQFGEEIMKKKNKISHIVYGHIHDSPPDAPQPTEITENGIKIINAAIPFRMVTNQEVITLVDFSKIAA